MRWSWCLLVMLPVFGCRKSGPSPEQLAETARIIDEARLKYEPLELARRAGLSQALGKTTPRPDLGRCPVKLDYANPLRPERRAGFDLERMEREALTLERLGLEFYGPDEVGTQPGPLFSSLEQALSGERKSPPEQARRTVEKFASPDFWNWDLIVVEDSTERARVIEDGKGYEGGTFVGTAYLWSFTEKKVACAADIQVRLPQTMHYTTRKRAGKAGQARDFELQANLQVSYLVLEQATQALMVAGPAAAGTSSPVP